MSKNIVIINAFEKDDFFVRQLYIEYENALKAKNINPKVFFVNRISFSYTPFPERYTFSNLEYDLQQCVQAIKMASTVAIFTSTSSNAQQPIFRQFISRLFHLKSGRINHDIWGQMIAYDKVMRIITVLNDPEIWKKFHKTRNKALVPFPKISFGLFGFGQVFSRTFGYLKEEDLSNEYAQKSLKAMRDIAAKD